MKEMCVCINTYTFTHTKHELAYSCISSQDEQLNKYKHTYMLNKIKVIPIHSNVDSTEKYK